MLCEPPPLAALIVSTTIGGIVGSGDIGGFEILPQPPPACVPLDDFLRRNQRRFSRLACADHREPLLVLDAHSPPSVVMHSASELDDLHFQGVLEVARQIFSVDDLAVLELGRPAEHHVPQRDRRYCIQPDHSRSWLQIRRPKHVHLPRVPITDAFRSRPDPGLQPRLPTITLRRRSEADPWSYLLHTQQAARQKRR